MFQYSRLRPAALVLLAAPVLLAALAAWPGKAAAQKAKAEEPPVEKELSPPSESLVQPGSFMAYDNTLWNSLAKEPQKVLTDARDRLADGHPGDAAESLRKVAAYVQLAAEDTTGDARPALEKALAGLRGAADSLDAGGGSGAATVNRVGAVTLVALSRHDGARAASEWSAKQYQDAAEDLQAAVADFHFALEWLHRDPTAEQINAINGAGEVVNTVLANDTFEPEAFAERIAAFRAAVRAADAAISG